MFNPSDTNAVAQFVNQYVATVQHGASEATGVKQLMQKIDNRVQRRCDAKQLLRLTAAQLVDAGWTRHDVAASNVKWGKMLRRHGATDLVRTLKLTLQDATEMGITAKQLLAMTSDLLAEWNVSAPDMIALGATVPQLLSRYETAENMRDMGFSRDIMVQLGMQPDRADAMFGADVANAVAPTPATTKTTGCRARLETVTIDRDTSLEF